MMIFDRMVQRIEWVSGSICINVSLALKNEGERVNSHEPFMFDERFVLDGSCHIHSSSHCLLLALLVFVCILPLTILWCTNSYVHFDMLWGVQGHAIGACQESSSSSTQPVR